MATTGRMKRRLIGMLQKRIGEVRLDEVPDSREPAPGPARLDAAGAPVWAHEFTGYYSFGLGADPTGGVTYMQGLPSSPEWFGTLVHRNAGGAVTWQLERDFQATQDIVADELGHVVVISRCTQDPSQVDPDVCLWAFSDKGEELWKAQLHDPELGLQHQGTSLRGDRLLLTAILTYTPPPEEMLVEQALDLFELDLNTGEVRSRHTVATGSIDFAGAPALLDGDLVVSGSFGGTVDFGIGTLVSDAGGDAFVAKLPWP
ncbi:MAG: hypothetical protein U0263_27800 [Polyangiaceae bacterium]